MYAVIDLFNEEILSFTMDEDGLTKKFKTIEEATKELAELNFGVIFDLEANQVVNPNPVIIEIGGKNLPDGMAYPIEKPLGINLIIRDFDNMDEDDREDNFPYDIEISGGKFR